MTEEIKKEEELKVVESKKKKERVEEEVKLVVNSGYAISRLNHPVQIEYNGSAIMLPPRGKIFFEDLSKVRNLPKEGCYVLKANN